MNQRKGGPKIQPKDFVAHKPPRCKAQSPWVRTFLGFATAPSFIGITNLKKSRDLNRPQRKSYCSFALMQKNQKIKAADNSGVHAFKPAHAIQLPRRFGRSQTVLLTRASAAGLNTFTFSRNSLRPVEIPKFLISFQCQLIEVCWQNPKIACPSSGGGPVGYFLLSPHSKYSIE
jgi:hypothetical protein